MGRRKFLPDRIASQFILALLAAFSTVVFSALVAGPVAAQIKPYARSAVSFIPAAADPTLATLVETLRKAAAEENISAIEAVLSPSLQVIVCKVDPLAACAPGAPGVTAADMGKPPLARLRDTLCCPGVAPENVTDQLRSETVAGHIGGALESGQMTGHDTPGLVCMPSWAIFDRAKARAMVAASGADAMFLRYASEEFEYRAKPDPKTPPAGKIAKGELVPMLSDVATQMPDGWYAIALPSGAIGYADAIGLEELTPSGTCFRKEASGWKIALVIAIE